MEFKCFGVLVVYLVVLVEIKADDVHVHLSCEPYQSSICDAKIPESCVGKEITLTPPKGTKLEIKNVRTLNLYAGVLNKLPSKIFEKLSNLQKLTVDGPEITDVSNIDLSSTTELTHLTIKNSAISHIPANAFSKLPKLSDLDLSENRINSIDDGAFTSSTLTDLLLRANQLTALSPNMFTGAERLDTIHLGNNPIAKIEEHTFDLPNLQIVLLIQTQLKKLPDNLFNEKSKLKTLYLTDNKLLETVMTAVEKAPKLKYLSLNDNTKLQENVLKEVYRFQAIETLHLDDANQSSLLQMGTVKSDTLKYLSLKKNYLRDPDLFEKLMGLRALKDINVDDNEFTELKSLGKISKVFPNFSYFSGLRNNWTPEFMNSHGDRPTRKVGYYRPLCLRLSTKNRPYEFWVKYDPSSTWERH